MEDEGLNIYILRYDGLFDILREDGMTFSKIWWKSENVLCVKGMCVRKFLVRECGQIVLKRRIDVWRSG